ncbi:YwiC-like family protein [Anaerobacillus sp. CMMVII]|uniref:YwiC-like family protein n=1 Tax=Anaerobacillus sp. CMMVII TaxID=2755588 RepID=UPI0021B7CEAE|nr:YwiC-like family protein [Anaerobacillus sp. CMMVII]MCT8140419.1 YwiC-like family protein [Anaerobacillus sp. CMMVII]
MKWFIPREHGAWAMLIVPYLVGMFASKVTLSHLIFFVGVLAFYFASGPFLAYIRKPTLKKQVVPAFIIYIAIGLLFTLPILYMLPNIILIGIFIIPFFLLNIVFAKMKKERLFVNDLSAITALSFLVLIAYYIGNGTVEGKALILMLVTIIFFTASVFHVKTLIRERDNMEFLWKSHFFHGIMIPFIILLGLPMVAIAFFISTLKAWFMPKTRRYKPIQIGLIEIANSIIFVVLIGMFN